MNCWCAWRGPVVGGGSGRCIFSLATYCTDKVWRLRHREVPALRCTWTSRRQLLTDSVRRLTTRMRRDNSSSSTLLAAVLIFLFNSQMLSPSSAHSKTTSLAKHDNPSEIYSHKPRKPTNHLESLTRSPPENLRNPSQLNHHVCHTLAHIPPRAPDAVLNLGLWHLLSLSYHFSTPIILAPRA